MAKARCPICKSEQAQAFKPFCSKRCADVDLARWLGGTYVIASDPDGDEDGTRPFGQPDGDEPLLN